MPKRILVVEDDPALLDLYAEVLRRAGYEVVTADSGPGATALLARSLIDAVITDLKLPEGDGLQILQRAKEAGLPDPVVILVTGFPTVETAVRAMKLGACEYLVKPLAPQELVEVLESALAKRRTKAAHQLVTDQPSTSLGHAGMLGRAPAMLTLFDDIQKTASVDANVLILGETGAGKELVARAIHERSTRREQAFLPINCAAIPESLLEAEMFGYERGAFTGAQGRKEGLLESADGGTVFLDEVCELTRHLQAKLLRALEEGAVRRLAGRTPIPFDVRFVAATNRDVTEERMRGRFREDLFFRLGVIEIRVPSLRERPQDIPLLATHFARVCAAPYGRTIEGVAPEAMELLARYHWPGNVRELKNAMERAVAYSKESLITPQDLPDGVRTGAERAPRSTFRAWRKMALEGLEREFLKRALAEHGGNVSRTARALRLHRSTLQRLMRRHSLPAA